MKAIELKEYQQVLREMLAYLDGLCRKHNIKYSLFAGSLIGAIRHKGIIPWDDDIDIVLMPKEYQKLLKVLANQDKTSHYALFCRDSNPDYYYPFAKLVDTRTQISEKGCKKITGYGAFIDIFCFYYMPDNLRAAQRVARRAHFFHNVLAATNKTTNYQNPAYNLASHFFRAVGKDYWLNRFDKSLCSRHAGRQLIMHNWPSTGNPKREILNAANFSKFTDAEFDGQKVMITKDYDAVLTTMYGDYMTPPPESERPSHHGIKAYWK